MNTINRSTGTANAKEQTGRGTSGLDVINPHAAGLDLHKEIITACAPVIVGDTRHPVRTFGTYTHAQRFQITNSSSS